MRIMWKELPERKSEGTQYIWLAKVNSDLVTVCKYVSEEQKGSNKVSQV